MTTKFNYCPSCAAPLVQTCGDGPPRQPCTAGCGFVHYDNPTPVVAAIVQVEQDVVLVQNEGWPGSWFGLVTGFVEKQEAPDRAILREVSEELGLDGEIIELVGVYGFEAMNQTIITYHVMADGVPHAGEELRAIKLVPVGELKPWPMGTGRAVADWLARRPQSD